MLVLSAVFCDTVQTGDTVTELTFARFLSRDTKVGVSGRLEELIFLCQDVRKKC